MFLLDQVLLPHALDRVVLVVLLVLAEHHLPECSATEHFEQFELLEGIDVVFVGFALEDDLAFGFDLLVLLDGLGVEVERFDGVQFFVVFAYVVDGGGELFEGEVVIVVQCHFLLVRAAVALDECFYDFEFEVGGGEAVVVFLVDVYDKL